MNNIENLQNEQKQLERLAAQRELYSAAKSIHVVQICITVIIPILLAIIAIKKTNIAPYAAALGLMASLLDVLMIEQMIKIKRQKAAKIQELFDCEVLNLDTSPLKIIDDIAVEEVLLHYQAHTKINSNIEKIRDWYPKNIGNLPIHIARIICQRENCWWDSKLRERYTYILKMAVIIVVILLFCFAQYNNLKFTDMVLLGSSLLPFFQFSIKQANEHKEAAKRLDELVRYSKDLWNSALDRIKNEDVITEGSRRLQDEIFEHRSKSPLILDMFYKRLRNKDEELVNRSTEILLEEAKNKGFG